MKPFPLIIGHRGAPMQAPENTLASFQKAIELGCDYIECDLHLSKEGVPIVIHDFSLFRTCRSFFPFWVGRQSLASLRRLNASSYFYPSFEKQLIPTLKEVLDLCADKIPLMLEIKAIHRPLEMISALKKYLPSSNTLLGCQSPKMMQLLESHLPSNPKIHILDKEPSISPSKQALSIRYFNPQSIKAPERTWVWTVNDERQLNHCLQAGVEGLISDKPEWLIEKKKSYQANISI